MTRGNDMNQETSFIQYTKDVKKMLSKLSKEVAIHVNEV